METLINTVTCIIKEYDFRPKVLFIDNFDSQTIALKPISGVYKNPLWFPRNIVFEFDEKLFEELNEAYNRGNQKLLKELWSKAKRWEPEEDSK